MEISGKLLWQVRSTFIEGALVEDDAVKVNKLRRIQSEPGMSPKFQWELDIVEKGSDSEHDFSDSTQDFQNGDDSSDSCFEDIDWYRQVTPECWLADRQGEPDMEEALRLIDQASFEPGTDAEVVESSHASNNIFDKVQGAESGNVSSVEKVAFKERVRWADIVDDPLAESCSDAKGLGTEDLTTMPLPEMSASLSEASEFATEIKMKRRVSTTPIETSDAAADTKTQRRNRRKSLIDKAANEQQYPGTSRLRSNAPAFVPMAFEAASVDKRLCKQCGTSCKQSQKFCNSCGTSFPVLPLAFMGGAINDWDTNDWDTISQLEASSSKSSHKNRRPQLSYVASNLSYLESKDEACVVAIKKITKLGLNASEALRYHFEQWGPVDDILFSTEPVNGAPADLRGGRIRPPGIGWIVMKNAVDAQQVLSHGEVQIVNAIQIRVLPFVKCKEQGDSQREC